MLKLTKNMSKGTYWYAFPRCALDYRWRWATLPVEGELGEGKWTGPICLFLVTPPSVVPPALTCRPSRRPTRRRTACPGGLLSIPVMWVTWWPHPVRAPPPGSNTISRTWNKIFRDDGEKEKDSPPPPFSHARQNPVPTLAVGSRCLRAHRSAFAGEETANMCVKPATSNGPCATA